ncbi:MAG: hypothetical protein UHK60_11530 [Acutalibacteraceae bacterium]|nr:hypothetical protein [Acutalibacteraceae bacterium]
MNNNVKTIKTNKTSKLATYRKAVITSSLVAMLVATSTISVAAAPAGVDTTSVSTVVDVIFWILGIAIAACTLLPGLLHIAQGSSNQDERLRNSGIMTCVIGVACIAALPVIRTLIF